MDSEAIKDSVVTDKTVTAKFLVKINDVITEKGG